jgi:hypothetical protein
MLAALVATSLVLPGTAVAQAATSFWLGRSTGTEYVYDVPLPADFAAVATCDPAKYARFTDFCATTTDAQGLRFVQNQISWDRDEVTNGSFAYARNGAVQGDWWVNVDKASPEWAGLTAELKRQAVGDAWKRVDLNVHVSQAASYTPVRVPIPELVQRKAAMSALAASTTSGTYYPDAKPPADLAGYREQMLAYGNAGRRDPDFRKTNKATTATDLTLDTVVTLGPTPEKVYRQRQTPPFFDDHRTTDALNKAAQFHAEYLASNGIMGHTGPGGYTEPGTGRSGVMTEAADRSRFFGGPGNVVEAAGMGGPGDFPYGWMKSETHFRPWFNVDGRYPEIGYGAAQAADGTWRFVALAVRNTDDPPAPSLAQVTLPITGKVGTTVQVDKPTVGVDATPPATTTGSTVDAQTQAESGVQAGVATTAPDAAPASSPAAENGEGIPTAVFDNACEGFAAYLRQEVASHQATRTSDPIECTVTSPDLQEATLYVQRIDRDAGKPVSCQDVAQGRATDPQSTWVQTLQSRATDKTLRAVASSGSPGKSFPFLVSVQNDRGKDVVINAIACDGPYIYNAHMKRDEGVNPLLVVNAAAEGLRRAAS